MESTDFASLFEKYLAGQVSPEETDKVLALLKDEAYKEQALQLIESYASQQVDILPVDTGLKERLEQRLQAILKTKEIPVIRRFWWAAAAVLVLSFGFYFLSIKKAPEQIVQQLDKNEIGPGGNRAILILANGSKVILDSMHTGTFAQQGNTNIIKTDSGKLSYVSAEKSSEVFYNTLTTPRGGQYQLLLSDGTKVWLDAASSITYPTAFIGKERKVEVSGQAYFEVVHKKDIPFLVSANGMDIRDIGTSFNVNTYSDEPASKITLIEGSIEIKNKSQNLLLKPGDQAVLNNGNLSVSKTADIEQVLAWKNGLFNFEGADLQTVLRQLSRWYDIEVVYESNPPQRKFFGGMSRDLSLSQLLEGFKEMKLKFRIDGKQLIVSQ